MTTPWRTRALAAVVAVAVTAVLRPVGAQEPTEEAVSATRPEDGLRLEVRGRPPTPQVLTVRPRGEVDWTRSIEEQVARVEPAILGTPPSLVLRVVPVDIPNVHEEAAPEPEETMEEGRGGPAAGRPGTRDPPDLR